MSKWHAFNGTRGVVRALFRSAQVAAGTRLRGTALPLVGVELVDIPYVTEGPPHLFYDLHVVECRSQRFGGGVHGIHRGVTGSLGCGSRLLTSGPCRFTGFPHALPFISKYFERLTMEIARLPRFFRESSELLRLGPGRLS